MNWSEMTDREKKDFIKSIEGQTVFAHSTGWRIWGVVHIFGPCLEISFGCRQLGMDSRGSAMIFFRIEKIINVKWEKNGPSYTIAVAD